MTIDDISYLDPESINGLNLYAYCGNNPVMRVDPNGKFFFSFLSTIAIAALVGSGVGAAGVLVSDLVTSAITGSWHFSSWEIYLGGAIGGAIGGYNAFKIIINKFYNANKQYSFPDANVSI